jgi:hypothetical protein
MSGGAFGLWHKQGAFSIVSLQFRPDCSKLSVPVAAVQLVAQEIDIPVEMDPLATIPLFREQSKARFLCIDLKGASAIILGIQIPSKLVRRV